MHERHLKVLGQLNDEVAAAVYDGRSIYGDDAIGDAGVVGYQGLQGAWDSDVGVGWDPANVGAAPDANVGQDNESPILLIGQEGPYYDAEGNEFVEEIGRTRRGSIKKRKRMTGRRRHPQPAQPAPQYQPNAPAPQQADHRVALDPLFFGTRLNIGIGASATLTVTPQAVVSINSVSLAASVAIADARVTGITIGTQSLFANTEAVTNGVLGTHFQQDNTMFNLLRGREIAAQTPLNFAVTNTNAAAQDVSLFGIGTAARGAVAGRVSPPVNPAVQGLVY